MSLHRNGQINKTCQLDDEIWCEEDMTPLYGENKYFKQGFCSFVGPKTIFSIKCLLKY